MASYDAIIIGAGHNGLTAGAVLAKAGYRVLVLERNERVGGAIQSGEVTQPGFVHDVYSTNQNLFLASPTYAELKGDLERHGLRFAISQKPYCNLFPDGTSLRVTGDPDETLERMRAHNPADAEGWQALYEQFKVFQKTLLPLYTTPLPSAEAALQLGKATTAKGVDEIAELAKIVLSSTRELGESYFATKEARALIATWGLHLDFGPDVSAGGMFPFLEAFTDMEEGMSVVEGGASNLVDALAAIIQEHGGDVRTGDAAARILTDGGRATDVETEKGERFYAEKAIVANLTPTVLFSRLLPDADLAQDFRDSVARFTYGPATMMMHLALDGPAPWKAGEDVHEYAYVHIAPYVEDLARTYTEAQNGLLPASPLLIVGQTTAVDASRTPGDEELLWVQVRTLPALIRGDAKGEIGATHWDEAKAPFAERVLAKLEDYAPGLRDKIIGQYVMSPHDLERGNPNLVGGDSIGGSHHLHQNFLWRPFFGWSRYKMPLENLYMVGAGTWPGGGNNATSGYLAAQEVLKADGLSVGQKVAAGAAGAVAAGALAAAIKKRIGEAG